MIGLFLNPLDRSVEMDVDTQFASRLYECIDQIRIEALQRASTSMKDTNLRASAHRDVGELERDVAAANKDDSLWQLLQLKELVALDQVFLTRNFQRRRFGASGDKHKAPAERIVANLKSCLVEKSRTTVKSGNSRVRVSSLLIFGHRVSKCPLEAHQCRPID